MSRLFRCSVIAATLFALTAAAPARADTYDKLAYLTFSGTVQIPGATLNAGTYRFHLTNPDTSRNVMQVLSSDGETVYAMFHTIPDVRAAVTLDPTVTFREVPADVPPPIHSVFYGGETLGYEFMYPNGEPNLTAAAVAQPPVTYSALVVPQVTEPRRDVVNEAPPEAAPIPELAPEPAVEPVTLPKTATHLPLVAFGGLVLLGAGIGMALARRA